MWADGQDVPCGPANSSGLFLVSVQRVWRSWVVISEFLAGDDLCIVIVEVQHQITPKRVTVVFADPVLVKFGRSVAHRLDAVLRYQHLLVFGHQRALFDFDEMVDWLDGGIAAAACYRRRQLTQTLFPHGDGS